VFRASRSISPPVLWRLQGALIHYAKGLSNQLIARHPRQCGVAGQHLFEGGIWQNIEKACLILKTAMSLNPTERMGTPQEVAAGVVFLASPVASRISGTNLIIDGALTKAV
jgi:NAD(P)-dependent dehydrogenase (short-subunit alcohol dehydrogenase family)